MQTLQINRPAGDRQPWFCSGCPHNTSTRVPEGSRAMAGIGCHFMSIWMDRATLGFTQMGGEGVPWVGQQPFSTEKHVFANLGDGTYFHSGLLAIRQAIAAGVNITYKLLYNDAVAMTGGQPVGEQPDGHSVIQMAHSLMAEGVGRVTVVTDEPDKYRHAHHQTRGGVTLQLPEGIVVEHRDELDRIQREFRELPGTTVIIYDQTCATEKRRRRKRGTLAEPDRRVVINEAVCEGCGDCGVQSNCLSVEPLETDLGRKRTINQNSCNKDFSCVNGFCPSFVTVEGGTLRQKSVGRRAPPPDSLGPLPEPRLPNLQAHPEQVWGMVVAGVGGTGVITIGQLLGVAAHLEGRAAVTQDAAGLAQKGGATWSHVLLAEQPEAIRTTRVSMASADVILGCDPIVTASAETLLRTRNGRTHVAINSHATPTAQFVKNSQWHNPAQACVAALAQAVGADQVAAFDADAAAQHLLGDTIYINPMVLGFAWQKGWVPLQRASVLKAMELNGVAVAQNQLAFEWGRHAAHRPAAFESVVRPAHVLAFKPRDTLETWVRRHTEFLTDYQDRAYAQRYEAFVRRVQQAERAVAGPRGGLPLAETVARQLFRLMAYKDEYEVARLHTHPSFQEKLANTFDGEIELRFHLAPPLLARHDARGHPVKQSYGPWVLKVFGLLARMKGVRGSVWDIFGKTQERRTERALIGQYQDTVEEILQNLRADNRPLAIELARVPDGIKGFGHVKARNLAAVRQTWEQLLNQWRQTTTKPAPTESGAQG